MDSTVLDMEKLLSEETSEKLRTGRRIRCVSRMIPMLSLSRDSRMRLSRRSCEVSMPSASTRTVPTRSGRLRISSYLSSGSRQKDTFLCRKSLRISAGRSRLIGQIDHIREGRQCPQYCSQIAFCPFGSLIVCPALGVHRTSVPMASAHLLSSQFRCHFGDFRQIAAGKTQ